MSIGFEEARKIGERVANDWGAEPGDSIVLVDHLTRTTPYGWIFFYQSKVFLETKDWSYRLAGNGPMVILAADGSVHLLGSALGAEEEIRAFEQRLGLQRGGSDRP